MPTISILDAMRDPKLFGPSFPEPSWHAWAGCVAALFGLSTHLSADDRHFIETCLGGRAVPTTPAREGWLIIGRRGGKSRVAALVALFLACFRSYDAVLAPGERGVVMLIAADRRQARVVHRYVAGLLHAVPLLESLIVTETRERIELSNRITIEVHAPSFRGIRGYTVVGAICDEIAFWRTDDSANPDSEILNALRPAMATVPDGLILCISSPYARRGELWRAYRDHFGQSHDRVMVWQADTQTMHPDVPRDVIEHAYAEDEAVASAEYGAQFRRDVESFVSRETIDAVVVPGRMELPSVSTVRYWGFADPSGGSQDAMTLAVSHRDGDQAVLDAVREVRPPFSPEAVVAEFVELLGRYQITTVRGDRYAGEWPREQFEKRGIAYEVCEQSKSVLYGELLAALNSHRVELLDHPRLIAQLARLERRTTRSGKDSIDHPPGAHDDLINAAAGALVPACVVHVEPCGVMLPPAPLRVLSAREVSATLRRGSRMRRRMWDR